MNQDSRDIHIFRDLEAVSPKAVSLFIGLCKEAVSERGVFVAALPGGSTPRRAYELLAAAPHRDEVDWKRVHIFWVDERCVDAGHDQSNFRLAHQALLSHVPVPEEHIHRIEGELGPDKAAAKYEADIRRFFRFSSGSSEVPQMPVFDLIMLGVGTDGHVASLFPGSDALNERTRPVVPIAMPSPQLSRVSLSLPVLDAARRILFLVSGGGKSAILAEILEGSSPTAYPAGLIRAPDGHVTWLVDDEAASRLAGPLRSGAPKRGN